MLHFSYIRILIYGILGNFKKRKENIAVYDKNFVSCMKTLKIVISEMS